MLGSAQSIHNYDYTKCYRVVKLLERNASFKKLTKSCFWHFICQSKKSQRRDFPGGAVVKNPPANAGDTGSSPDPGRSHMPQSS